MGLPLSVLAAFIERPFITRAGVERNAIWFSLQANFVSLLVGYFATMIVIPIIMSPGGGIIGLTWPFLAVGISIATERWYLAIRLRKGGVPWGPLVGGNISSAVTCVAVLVLVANLRDSVPQLSEELGKHSTVMNLGVAIASFLLLAGSFAVQNPRMTTEQCVGRGSADTPSSDVE